MQVTGTLTTACLHWGVTWAITNGTPPYQYAVDYLGGVIGSGTSNSNTGVFNYTGISSSVTVEFVDANSCVATVTLVPSIWHYGMDTEGRFTLNVNGANGTGTLVFLNDLNPSCDPGAIQFQLTNVSSGSIIDSGTLQDNWTEAWFGGPWTYDPVLQSGTYTMEFFGEVGCGNAFPWNAIECWLPPSNGPLELVIPPPGNSGVNVQLRMALGAVRIAGSMRDDLRAQGLLPTSEPYTALGYTYTGAPPTSVTPALFAVTGANAVVDWVIAELRQPAAPHTVVASKPCLLQRDGDVMDIDGDEFVNFPGQLAGAYRLAVRHRNHLGAMTGIPIDLSTTPTLVDLRYDASMPTYGTNAQTVVHGLMCLWPGNANFDDKIKYTAANNDRDPILTAIGGGLGTNVLTNQYSRLDVNMDGKVQYVGPNNDRDPILVNVGGNTPTNTRVQQLP